MTFLCSAAIMKVRSAAAGIEQCGARECLYVAAVDWVQIVQSF